MNKKDIDDLRELLKENVIVIRDEKLGRLIELHSNNSLEEMLRISEKIKTKFFDNGFQSDKKKMTGVS